MSDDVWVRDTQPSPGSRGAYGCQAGPLNHDWTNPRDSLGEIAPYPFHFPIYKGIREKNNLDALHSCLPGVYPDRGSQPNHRAHVYAFFLLQELLGDQHL